MNRDATAIRQRIAIDSARAYNESSAIGFRRLAAVASGSTRQVAFRRYAEECEELAARYREQLAEMDQAAEAPATDPIRMSA